jgi:hypothetical protein
VRISATTRHLLRAAPLLRVIMQSFVE